MTCGPRLTDYDRSVYNTEMADFIENVAGNLQQRIGQLVASYEGQLAVTQAQAQEELEKRDARIKELEEQLGVAEEEPTK